MTSDLEFLGIEIPISEIRKTSAETFKRIVSEKIIDASLKYLNEEKSKHSKVLHISHKMMQMQDYLAPNEITNEEAKLIFQIRCRMLEVRTNYSGSYGDLRCPLCNLSEDSQQHLLECDKLAEDEEGEVATKKPEYNDIFSEKLKPKAEIARIIISRYKKRKKILKKKEEKQ